MTYTNDQDSLDAHSNRQASLVPPLLAPQPEAPLMPHQRFPYRPRRALTALGLAIGAALLIVLMIVALFASGQLRDQTSTRQATVTSTVPSLPTATSTALPTPSPFSGTLAFTDPLKVNHYAWCHDVYAKEWSFSNGALHINNVGAVGASYVPCFPKGLSFGDFAYQVEMTITKADRGADGGGIIFRATNPVLGGFDRYYYFRIGPDGSYDLRRSSSNAPDVTLRHGFSSAIPTGLNQVVLLGGVALGSRLDLYVNAQFVLEVEDTTYTQGSIGLLAYDSGHPMNEADPPVQVMFRNIKVWLPANSLASASNPATNDSLLF